MERAFEDLLSVQVERFGVGVAILRITGEIDLSSAHLLSGGLSDVVNDGFTHVVLDATQVTFMDSTGLHALVEGKRAMHEKGAKIYLVPSKQVRRVLELVFPDPLFAARLDSVDQALADIQNADVTMGQPST